jgi:outer membrane murein-binding lipoprotein Lpp
MHEGSDRIATEVAELRAQIAGLTRRIDALHADVERIARTAVRFGRDIELRERGYA